MIVFGRVWLEHFGNLVDALAQVLFACNSHTYVRSSEEWFPRARVAMRTNVLDELVVVLHHVQLEE